PTFKVEILSFVETYGYLAIFISSFLMDLIVQPFAPDVPLIAGVIALLGLLFPDYSMWLILVPVLGLVVFIILYSYFEYQKQTKK
ncbi:unnamed protein product, partial [marine sediment metagenome]